MDSGIARARLLRLLAWIVPLLLACAATAVAPPPQPKFQVSFPASVHAQPITGRVFVIISNKADPEPRLAAGSLSISVELFGVDVASLKRANPP